MKTTRKPTRKLSARHKKRISRSLLTKSVGAAAVATGAGAVVASRLRSKKMSSISNQEGPLDRVLPTSQNTFKGLTPGSDKSFNNSPIRQPSEYRKTYNNPSPVSSPIKLLPAAKGKETINTKVPGYTPGPTKMPSDNPPSSTTVKGFREKTMWFLNNRAAKDRAKRDVYLPKIKKVFGFNARDDFWMSFEERRNANVLEFARKRKPHSEATKRKISESLRKAPRKRSKAQNFKDISSSIASLTKAGVSIDKQITNRKLASSRIRNTESIIRQRNFSRQAGVFDRGLATAKVLKPRRKKGGMNPIYAKGVYINAASRATVAGFKIPKGLRI